MTASTDAPEIDLFRLLRVEENHRRRVTTTGDGGVLDRGILDVGV